MSALISLDYHEQSETEQKSDMCRLSVGIRAISSSSLIWLVALVVSQVVSRLLRTEEAAESKCLREELEKYEVNQLGALIVSLFCFF